MNPLYFLFLLAATSALGADDDRVLLARFEIKSDAFEGAPKEREAVIFYTRKGEVEVERISMRRSHAPVSIGTHASQRLIVRLKKIIFPKLDYQSHFERLAKQPEKPSGSLDGQEVEVEIRFGGAHVLFKRWNPGGFLQIYDDDSAAIAVNAAVEAFVLSIGMGVVFFSS